MFRQLLLATVTALSTFYLLEASANQQSLTPDVLHGERLFQETRFAQYFYDFVTRGGDINEPLDRGDPKLEKTFRFFGLPPYQIPFTTSPFRGKSYSCRTCHMVDEHIDQNELGMRALADFASRSPLSSRKDNQLVTVRNSPVLVGSLSHRDNFVLHYDGEFSSVHDLVVSTLTGRNLGWLPSEHEVATMHICNVIRDDDGTGELAEKFGGLSYAEVFSGLSDAKQLLPEKYLITASKRIKVSESTCSEIVTGVAYLLERYLGSLKFSRNSSNYSPYDRFLAINGLPGYPSRSESDEAYSDRLVSLIESFGKNGNLKFVKYNPNTDDGKFRYHDQPYQFTELELLGLKIFFSQKPTPEQGAGNCGSCHAAPHFTDFSLHNIGVTQVEYEAIHGQGSFQKLYIPTRKIRDKEANVYLPATPAHPDRVGIFRKAASQSNAVAADLGAWNIFLNDDYPSPQEQIYNQLCNGIPACETAEQALQKAIATFKTPTLRNLGHSAPYMHNGQISDLHATVGFYIASSRSAKYGLIRNADSELRNIQITSKDIQPLVSFMISLYEDYY